MIPRLDGIKENQMSGAIAGEVFGRLVSHAGHVHLGRSENT